MPKVHQAAKWVAKDAKVSMVSSICYRLSRVQKTNNDNPTPHGFITKVVNKTKALGLEYNITRHNIRNNMKCEDKKERSLELYSKIALVLSTKNTIVPSSEDVMVSFCSIIIFF